MKRPQRDCLPKVDIHSHVVSIQREEQSESVEREVSECLLDAVCTSLGDCSVQRPDSELEIKHSLAKPWLKSTKPVVPWKE